MATHHNQADSLLLGIHSGYQITLGICEGPGACGGANSYIITQELKEREEGAGFPQLHPSEIPE